MSASFQAFIWRDLDISMHTRNVRLVRGLYELKLLRDERGHKSGAELKSLDLPGEPITRLTPDEFEMLEGTEFFERR